MNTNEGAIVSNVNENEGNNNKEEELDASKKYVSQQEKEGKCPLPCFQYIRSTSLNISKNRMLKAGNIIFSYEKCPLFTSIC